MINGYRVFKSGADEFTLRQPGTRNKMVLGRNQLARMFKLYWGFL